MGLIARLFGKKQDTEPVPPPAPAEQPPTSPVLQLPPRRPGGLRPQVKQLLTLIERRDVHAAELARIEADREETARPIAEEIERLEIEEEGTQGADAELTSISAEIDRTIVEVEAELQTLRELRGIAAESLAEKGESQRAIRVALAEVRARFEDIMTPAHAKHLKHRIRHIDGQMERILKRHPELRITDLDMKVDMELVKQGAAHRVQAVGEALATQAFGDAFQAACEEAKGTKRAPRNELDIAALARVVLHGLGVATKDVHFTVFWSGDKGNKARGLKPNQLGFGTPVISSLAREACKAEILKREQQPAASEARRDAA